MVQDNERDSDLPVHSSDSFEELKKFRQALISFSTPDDSTVKRLQGFTKCPNRDVEDYFEFVAKVGKPYFKWEIIRPAFLWKLDQVISDMEKYECEDTVDSRINMSSKEELCTQREFIMKKASEFDGTPFTFQRLCELLITPSRHYKRLDKYLRALEKNINVVTTVTEFGERVTGVDEYLEDDDERPRGIEQSFFIKENGSPVAIKNFPTALEDYGKVMETSDSDSAAAKDSPLGTKDNSNNVEPMEVEGGENDSNKEENAKANDVTVERGVTGVGERNSEYHQESTGFSTEETKK